MVSPKNSSNISQHSSYNPDSAFWQQLAEDFPFHGVDEEKLRQQTEQWMTCASEILGPPPLRTKKKAKR